VKVTLKYKNYLHFTAFTRHFKEIPIDEPPSFHGTDQGPSPVEYFLIGIGGCIGNTFVYCLQKKDVEIENLEILIEGNLKHMGPKMRLKLATIDCKVLFTPKNERSNEDIEKCIKEFKGHCVLSNSIIKHLHTKVQVLKKQ
jgi:uncharacterized OsmC-like protein